MNLTGIDNSSGAVIETASLECCLVKDFLLLFNKIFFIILFNKIFFIIKLTNHDKYDKIYDCSLNCFGR